MEKSEDHGGFGDGSGCCLLTVKYVKNLNRLYIL